MRKMIAVISIFVLFDVSIIAQGAISPVDVMMRRLTLMENIYHQVVKAQNITDDQITEFAKNLEAYGRSIKAVNESLKDASQAKIQSVCMSLIKAGPDICGGQGAGSYIWFFATPPDHNEEVGLRGYNAEAYGANLFEIAFYNYLRPTQRLAFYKAVTDAIISSFPLDEVNKKECQKDIQESPNLKL
jgi:hypothetical protein